MEKQISNTQNCAIDKKQRCKPISEMNMLVQNSGRERSECARSVCLFGHLFPDKLLVYMQRINISALDVFRFFLYFPLTFLSWFCSLFFVSSLDCFLFNDKFLPNNARGIPLKRPWRETLAGALE